MKTHVVKVAPEASLSEAVDLMDIYQVNSLPVVDSDGRVCGMVAEHDVLKALCSCINDGGTEARFLLSQLSKQAAAVSVSDVMQRTVISTPEDADVIDVARLLFVNGFTRMPVISSDGRVVGTLNRIDIVQAVFEGHLPGTSL